MRCGDRVETASRGTHPGRVGGVAGAVVILLAALSTACARSDSDQINRRLAALAQIVSVEDQETPMIRQARATHLSTYLTTDANVDVGAPFSPVSGRDGVGRMAATVQVPAGGVRVEFTDVRVTVDTQTGHALAIVIASVTSGTAPGGEPLQARALNMVFSEVGGEWLIERVWPVAPADTADAAH